MTSPSPQLRCAHISPCTALLLGSRPLGCAACHQVPAWPYALISCLLAALAAQTVPTQPSADADCCTLCATKCILRCTRVARCLSLCMGITAISWASSHARPVCRLMLSLCALEFHTTLLLNPFGRLWSSITPFKIQVPCLPHHGWVLLQGANLDLSLGYVRSKRMVSYQSKDGPKALNLQLQADDLDIVIVGFSVSPGTEAGFCGFWLRRTGPLQEQPQDDVLQQVRNCTGPPKH